MLNPIHTQLTELLAFARSALQAIDTMLMQAMPGKRPAVALVPVPVNNRGRQVSSVSCDRGYEAFTGIPANAAVRLHADPVTEGWRSLDFGKTKTGITRHSQPSRFAT